MSATEPAQSPSPRILFPGEWLICFAVKEEAQCFNLPDSAIHTLITGIGCTNVERAIKAAVQKRKPALVLTCGFAGGLDPSLAKGAVLFACDSAPALHATLLAAGAQPAQFHCTDRIAGTAGGKPA